MLEALIALWENETPFTYRHLEEPGVAAELAQLWLIAKFPLLLDGDTVIPETSM